MATTRRARRANGLGVGNPANRASLRSDLSPGRILYPVPSRPPFRRCHGRRKDHRDTATGVPAGLIELADGSRTQREASAAQEIVAGARNCTELETRSRQFPDAMSRKVGQVDLQQLPPEVQRVIMPLAPGQSTPPVRVAEGSRF